MKNYNKAIILLLLILSTIVLFLVSPKADAMDYEVLESNEVDVVIEATGEIKPFEAAALRIVLFDATIKNPDAAVHLIISSNGGVISEAITMARLIRSYKASTHVPPGARCYSACTIVFLGGTERQSLGTLGYHNAWYEPTVPTCTVGDIVDEFVTGQAFGVGILNQIIDLVEPGKMREFLSFYASVMGQSAVNGNRIIFLPKQYCKQVGVCN